MRGIRAVLVICMLVHDASGQGWDMFAPHGMDMFATGVGGGGFGMYPPTAATPVQPDPAARDAQITAAEEQMAEAMSETSRNSPERQRIDRLIQASGGRFTGDAANLNYLVQEYIATSPGPSTPPPPENPPPQPVAPRGAQGRQGQGGAKQQNQGRGRQGGQGAGGQGAGGQGAGGQGAGSQGAGGQAAGGRSRQGQGRQGQAAQNQWSQTATTIAGGAAGWDQTTALPGNPWEHSAIAKWEAQHSIPARPRQVNPQPADAGQWFHQTGQGTNQASTLNQQPPANTWGVSEPAAAPTQQFPVPAISTPQQQQQLQQPQQQSQNHQQWQQPPQQRLSQQQWQQQPQLPLNQQQWQQPPQQPLNQQQWQQQPQNKQQLQQQPQQPQNQQQRWQQLQQPQNQPQWQQQPQQSQNQQKQWQQQPQQPQIQQQQWQQQPQQPQNQQQQWTQPPKQQAQQQQHFSQPPAQQQSNQQSQQQTQSPQQGTDSQGPGPAAQRLQRVQDRLHAINQQINEALANPVKLGLEQVKGLQDQVTSLLSVRNILTGQTNGASTLQTIKGQGAPQPPIRNQRQAPTPAQPLITLTQSNSNGPNVPYKVSPTQSHATKPAGRMSTPLIARANPARRRPVGFRRRPSNVPAQGDPVFTRNRGTIAPPNVISPLEMSKLKRGAGTTVAPVEGDMREVRGNQYRYTDADGYDVFQWVLYTGPPPTEVPQTTVDPGQGPGQVNQGQTEVTPPTPPTEPTPVDQGQGQGNQAQAEVTSPV
ncbi:uncharacterized protein LOC127856862 [Dreissena polymorpha]|uniref:Uncharacterized protein n=1 Tax=Dreissena polymorpha TaxID=45954 RepID=A0A9D3YZK2_DREPO|nr:uncharacterized protein LOC127856862 [Dreissena polymorpha]KAH3707991.1 hypothetical protein DPMN_067430 [Dreissena polymorpha]